MNRFPSFRWSVAHSYFFCIRPSILSLYLNLHWSAPCSTSFSAPFYNLTYSFSYVCSLCTSLLPLCLLLCLFYLLCISAAYQLCSPQILRQFSPGSTWPPSLFPFHSLCTMSLLATAITVYHYLASKVTLSLLSFLSCFALPSSFLSFSPPPLHLPSSYIFHPPSFSPPPPISSLPPLWDHESPL